MNWKRGLRVGSELRYTVINEPTQFELHTAQPSFTNRKATEFMQ